MSIKESGLDEFGTRLRVETEAAKSEWACAHKKDIDSLKEALLNTARKGYFYMKLYATKEQTGHHFEHNDEYINEDLCGELSTNPFALELLSNELKVSIKQDTVNIYKRFPGTNDGYEVSNFYYIFSW